MFRKLEMSLRNGPEATDKTSSSFNGKFALFLLLQNCHDLSFREEVGINQGWVGDCVKEPLRLFSIDNLYQCSQPIKSKTATTFDGRKGVGDEVLELLIGVFQDDTGQVVGNERTKTMRTLLSNNNQAAERS